MTCDLLKKIIKSPLRYPGGKGAFYPYFSELMKKNGLKGGAYFEPFAGGAGVALGLLSTDTASCIFLNDADYHIYCFWVSVLNNNEQFLEKIWSVELSIKEWQKQKEIYSEPAKYSMFEVGFSAFYLNRCNRSGILVGAGPIGGYGQSGTWRLDARFNKKNLITRVADIGELRHRIFIENLDAICFLKKCLPNGSERKDVLVYIDPPYVAAGNRLYLNYYLDKDHKVLADYLINQVGLNWVVTYDDSVLIRILYSSCQKWLFSLGYSLQSKKVGKELLIVSDCLLLPDENEFSNNKWNIVGKT